MGSVLHKCSPHGRLRETREEAVTMGKGADMELAGFVRYRSIVQSGNAGLAKAEHSLSGVRAAGQDVPRFRQAMLIEKGEYRAMMWARSRWGSRARSSGSTRPRSGCSPSLASTSRARSTSTRQACDARDHREAFLLRDLQPRRLSEEEMLEEHPAELARLKGKKRRR